MQAKLKKLTLLVALPVLSLGTLSLLACDNDRPGAVDAGADAGFVGADAGVDAGVDRDAGQAEQDADVPDDAHVDSDARVDDAGQAVDAGSNRDAAQAVDAGQNVDAGQAVDAGQNVDAGQTADAGQDAGSDFYEDMVGYWTFDNAADLTQATLGNDLQLVGQHSFFASQDQGQGAVHIGSGSYYRCFHDMAATPAGASLVNSYSIVMDIRVPQLQMWHALFQTDTTNSSDAKCFVSPEGKIGKSFTGYSAAVVRPAEWYRLVVTVQLPGHVDYYLDGQPLYSSGELPADGHYGLSPVDQQNELLFFADDNGEDKDIDVAQLMLFDRALNPDEIARLGGYGHSMASVQALPAYLQSRTAHSVYISWPDDSSRDSLVQYGTDDSLGAAQTGSVDMLAQGKIWHTVKLSGLSADTKYYYRCVSGDQTSPLRSFKTPADSGQGHVRFIVYGDSRADPAMHQNIIRAMKDRVLSQYGQNIEDSIDVIMNVGDIVTDGTVIDQFQQQYFAPIAELSKNVPFMVAIGNHEREADNYYDYMKFSDFQEQGGEAYYAFAINRVLFVVLDSNIAGATQLSWLQNRLDAAQNDANISWIFAFFHHPGRTEIWPDGNNDWIQNQVLPLLATYSKAEAVFYGHSHDYERGVWDSGNLRMILSGGGGSALDRWGMYDNQQNYPEIHRSMAYFSYTVFDVDLDNNAYAAKSYTLGNEDVSIDNQLFDSFGRQRNAATAPRPSAQNQTNSGNTVTLYASALQSDSAIMSSQFQITSQQSDWSNPVWQSLRHFEDIYGDTGASNYSPIDLNHSVDLSQATVIGLNAGTRYWWRMRYRDQNLHWTDWSNVMSFVP